MVIADIQHCQSLIEEDTIFLIGGNATAISVFSAIAYGKSSRVNSFIKNKVVSPSFASSYVSVTSEASGENSVSISSAASAVSVG